jgi:CDP-glycerol glycerophosphotransferase (TagB/SpsB family)
MALSIMVDESIRILEQVIDSGLVESEEFEFILKPHPVVQLDTLKNRLGVKWSSRFQEGENSTPEEIRNSDLLITGMSSVGLEAVVMGVPVIVVETMRGLSYNPIPESVPKELWRNCRSPAEILEAINAFRNRSAEKVRQHQELSASIKNAYFEPVTREGVYKFLELDALT